ncbi:MAG: D-amino acid aminotransferase [Nitrospirae bacterium]|nr:D-amino acid aminotransferase [Nitrospirota bacterium]
MPNIAVLNGRLMPLSRAMVSVEDRGYTFGDGVYEVVRVYRGAPFLLREHLERFTRSAEAIGLPLTPPPAGWERWVKQAITASRYDEAKIYFSFTRGVAPREHAFPVSPKPTRLITVRPLAPPSPASHDPHRGVRVVTMPDLRWGRCDIKSLNLLPNILAKQAAKQRGAFEAVLVRPGVGVTEGASSNVFAVLRDGTVRTPPAGPTILTGVTREAVIAVARRGGVTVVEAPLDLDTVGAAAELFLTGTLTEIAPITRWDDRVVGDGRPGPVTRRLMEQFLAWIEARLAAVSSGRSAVRSRRR